MRRPTDAQMATDLRASEAYALLEANITGGAVHAETTDDPLCLGLVARGLMYRPTLGAIPEGLRACCEPNVPLTFCITDAGRAALAASTVLRGRTGYTRGDWAKLWAEGE